MKAKISLTKEYVHYDAGNITKKNHNKKLFLASLGRERRAKHMVVTFVQTKATLTEKEQKVYGELAMALDEVGITHFYLHTSNTTSDPKKGVFSLKKQDKDYCGILMGSDVLVYFEDKVEHMEDIHELARQYGVVEVISSKADTVGIPAYDPRYEQGYGFIANEATVYQLFAKIIKVHSVYDFSYDWNVLRRQAMTT